MPARCRFPKEKIAASAAPACAYRWSTFERRAECCEIRQFVEARKHDELLDGQNVGRRTGQRGHNDGRGVETAVDRRCRLHEQISQHEIVDDERIAQSNQRLQKIEGVHAQLIGQRVEAFEQDTANHARARSAASRVRCATGRCAQQCRRARRSTLRRQIGLQTGEQKETKS